MACVTSCSRTFFAFSRDRAVPGSRLWSVVSKQAQGAGGRGARLLLPCRADPDPPGAYQQRGRSPGRLLRGRLDRGDRSLHRLRDSRSTCAWRKGDNFKPGSWTLGAKYQWLNTIAVVWVIAHVDLSSAAVHGPPGVLLGRRVRLVAVNFSPLIVTGVPRRWAISLAWVLGMNKRYTGPVRTISFDEGMGITEEDEAEPPPSAPADGIGAFGGRPPAALVRGVAAAR